MVCGFVILVCLRFWCCLHVSRFVFWWSPWFVCCVLVCLRGVWVSVVCLCLWSFKLLCVVYCLLIVLLLVDLVYIFARFACFGCGLIATLFLDGWFVYCYLVWCFWLWICLYMGEYCYICDYG